MPSAIRQVVAPGYLLVCLILGGSAQGIFFNLLLQLAGLAIITWAAAAAPPEEPPAVRVVSHGVTAGGASSGSV
jgi:hypothetical protein